MDGMFAILIPVALTALIIALLWAERKAKKLARLDSPKPRTCSASSPPSPERDSTHSTLLLASL
jgi:FtsZ-interacting cell division protein ZipA